MANMWLNLQGIQPLSHCRLQFIKHLSLAINVFCPQSYNSRAFWLLFFFPFFFNQFLFSLIFCDRGGNWVFIGKSIVTAQDKGTFSYFIKKWPQMWNKKVNLWSLNYRCVKINLNNVSGGRIWRECRMELGNGNRIKPGFVAGSWRAVVSHFARRAEL